MAIPDLSQEGFLPPGRHIGTWAEIEERFVEGAPFEARRRDLSVAFQSWLSAVRVILPDALTLWVDGSFVTRKAEPPADVDVVAFVPASTVNSLSPLVGLQLRLLLTMPGHKPTGGLIDAYLAEPTAETQRYWNNQWSRVRGADRRIIPGVKKGYLEVRP